MGTEDYSWLNRKRPRRGRTKAGVKASAPAPFKTRASSPLARRRRYNKSKDAVILETEASLELKEIWARRYPRASGLVSKVSSARSRQNPLLHRELLKRIGKIVKDGGLVALSKRAPRLVLKEGKGKPPSKTPWAARSTRIAINRHLAPEARKRIKKITTSTGTVHAVSVPGWDHASMVLKALAYGAAIPVSNRATINLNISEKVALDAFRSRKGFAGYMEDRIVRALNETVFPETGFLPDFMFVVEFYGGFEIPHLHGVYDTSWRSGAASPRGFDLREVFDQALRTAGGNMGKATARQQKSTPTDNLPGWFDYNTKRLFVTEWELALQRRRLGLPALRKRESLFGITKNLRRRGKDWYLQARASEAPVLWPNS